MPASGNCDWIKRREVITAGDWTHRSDILQIYQRLLGGESVGGKTSHGLLVRFSPPGVLNPLYAKVRDKANTAVLAHFLFDKLTASRKSGDSFVYLCIGDPPSGNLATSKLLESFDTWGSWVGSDVSESERSKILAAVKEIRTRFPRESLPTFPLAKLWKQHASKIIV
ncbi:MAG: hypothetical protein Q7S86_03975 [bacterium]|nr:hypothetical protein [bacterium]